jgi:pyroglutamyl-peptidase
VRTLVTGFEVFGDHAVNPSQLLAEALDGVVLPVSYARASDTLRAAIDERDPELVVCFGLADGDTAISIERFAHNLDEASAVDNEGTKGSGAEIDPAGPLALRATLPVDDIVTALRDADIPVTVSRDAGGYLCNHIFYVLMRALKPGRLGGFVHVPEYGAIDRETQLRAAELILATSRGSTS